MKPYIKTANQSNHNPPQIKWRPGEPILKDHKVDAWAALQRNAQAAELASARILRFKTRQAPITAPDGGERRAA
jgi:hypothetical protein